MDMATLQFYKNPYVYPNYGSITSYGTSLTCTPVGVDLRGGSIRVRGDFNDFMSCNYLSLTRDGKTIYAWIDNAKFRTEDSFDVYYTIDAWRTYKSKIVLSNQFISRSPISTNKYDRLLGSADQTADISCTKISAMTKATRTFVVQTRPVKEGIHSNTPVQPSPYTFYFCDYLSNEWASSEPLKTLMEYLMYGAKPLNIVTMYSIPFFNLSGMVDASLPVEVASGLTAIDGFKGLTGIENHSDRLQQHYPLNIEGKEDLLRTDHSVQIVIPEAGIINVPDELLIKTDLELRQDIDLFSGASNYMLTSDNRTNFYTQSVRGSSTSSIPIVSDPLDTYLSQNQNALATSLIGDVAMIGGGIATAVGTGGIGAVMGAGGVMTGINNIIDKGTKMADISNQYSNPPAFLGTALATKFNKTIWIVITKKKVDNKTIVNNMFGFPYGKVAPLTFPDSGFIQTEGCNVSSDGSVPRWAIEEIDRMFDTGILVF